MPSYTEPRNELCTVLYCNCRTSYMVLAEPETAALKPKLSPLQFSPCYEHCGGKTWWFNTANISSQFDAILRKSFSSSFRRRPYLSKDSNHGLCESVVTQYFTVKLFVLHAAIEADGQSFESAVCDCHLLSIFADALHPHQKTVVTW
jgi:hypothetical protein